MTTDKKDYKETEDQDFMRGDEYVGGEEYPNCEGEPCVNMAYEDDIMAENGSADEGGQNLDAETAEENSPQYEAALWKEKYTRLSAEYENYRKRTLKEKMELIAAGGEDVVRSMLEVLDDMDRALAAIEKTDDLESVKQGVVLIDNKLRGALRTKGLAEIEAVGQELDTDLHEAIARIKAGEEAMKGKIADVVQKGYKLKDRVIRHAKVVVAQ
jgi:molecular chaperone GrpE